MQLTRFNPKRNVWEVNTLFNHFFDEPLNKAMARSEGVRSERWNPKVDIHNTKKSFFLKAELPGVDKGDINVDVDGRVLSIKGERKEQEKVSESCYRREMLYGKFERTFTLPEAVESARINADFKNGILTLEIPKPEEHKPKEITIH